MASRAKQPQEPEVQADEFTPPYYEATEVIHMHHPNGETMPLRWYNPGDQVPAETVEAFKLGAQVKVPAVFEGQLADPSQHVQEESPAGEPAGEPAAEIPQVAQMPDSG